MTGERQEWTAADCNIPGVVAGICLIALPFLGFWDSGGLCGLATVHIPVSLSLNSAFWYALVSALIAVYSGIYQKRRYYGEHEEGTAKVPTVPRER